jgi:hypothetical protein
MRIFSLIAVVSFVSSFGPVNVVLAGIDYVNDGGSFTLTSGVLDRDPIARI